jgi:hypothetical protein
MGVVTRETPVDVYIDSECVGYGSIVYEDGSAVHIAPYTVTRCSVTQILIDSVAVPMQFCWGDVVTGVFGGVVKRVVEAKVYVGEVEVGKASIEVVDSFSASALTYMLVFSLFIALLRLVGSMVKRVRG